jgi:hypothetical protein
MGQVALNQQGFKSALAVTDTAAVIPDSDYPTDGNGLKLRPKHIQVRVIGQSIRWRADGGTATTTVGELVEAGDRITFMDSQFDYQSMIEKLNMVRATGSSATVDIIFFD